MHILTRRKLIRRALTWSAVGVVLAAFFLLGFSRHDHVGTIERDGTLRVVLLNDQRHYSNNNTTFEMTLVQLLANELGVDADLQTVDTYDELQRAMRLGFADLAAGGLVIPPDGDNYRDMRFSRPYMDAQQQVVYTDTSLRDKDDMLNMTGGVRPGTPQSRALARLTFESEQAAENGESEENGRPIKPEIRWIDGTTEDLLTALNQGDIDYAIIDSNDYAWYQPFFPSLRHAFDISEPQSVAWMFSAEKDGSLMGAANEFLDQIEQSGQLAIVLDQHFGHLREFDYVGVRRFERHVRNRLPPLRDDFESTAEEVGLDWRLLAAVGYQESHWRPNAVSPTGVRGIMMLTLRTAGDLGVTNRLSPSQSINGGGRYLADLYRRVPEEISDPDRMWMALAAYNVGMGHVMDARRIAVALEREPNYWTEMQEILPKLRDPEYYRFTRFGFARGDEPVIYVQNIRRYYDLLRWMFPTDEESNGIMPGLQPEAPSIIMPPLL